MFFPIRLITATIILGVSMSPTRADPQQELERFRAAANELGEELTTCAAFFQISAIGFEAEDTPQDVETAKQMKVQAHRAVKLAIVISDSIQQKSEVISARLSMSIRALRNEMADDFINYSILLNKYMDKCTEIMADPKKTIAVRLGDAPR